MQFSVQYQADHHLPLGDLQLSLAEEAKVHLGFQVTHSGLARFDFSRSLIPAFRQFVPEMYLQKRGEERGQPQCLIRNTGGSSHSTHLSAPEPVLHHYFWAELLVCEILRVPG